VACSGAAMSACVVDRHVKCLINGFLSRATVFWIAVTISSATEMILAIDDHK
jgi:hypothetical protein